MKTTWKDLSIKDKLALISASAAFTIGWALTCIAAFVPILLSEQGVLWILGQALIYAASVFGLGMYFKNETVQMKDNLNRHLAEIEKLQLEREKIRKGIDVPEVPNE